MKRIGIDAREFVGRMTGIARMLSGFLSSDTVRLSGHEFVLFGNQRTRLPQELERYELVRMREIATPWFDQVSLARAASARDIDIFYSPYPKIPAFGKIPAVISLFDTTCYSFDAYRRSFASRAGKAMLGLLLARARRTVTISRHSKDDIEKTFGTAPGHIAVVYPGLDKRFKPAEHSEIERVKAACRIGGPYMLYVGNARPHKNLARLAAAYGTLSPDIRKAYPLVLAGTGRAGIANCLQVDVRDEDLPALYSGASLFVFPSLYEGFGLPPLEAMACGCPVASSGATAMPEALGDACLYFDPRDAASMAAAMRQLLTDEEARKQCKANGIERAKRYDMETMAGGILSVLESAGDVNNNG